GPLRAFGIGGGYCRTDRRPLLPRKGEPSMNTRTQQITQEFYSLHPDLSFLQEELLKTFQLLSDTFRAGGKLLICGNGGSSADSEHIVGELMKGFLLKRPLSIGKKAA